MSVAAPGLKAPAFVVPYAQTAVPFTTASLQAWKRVTSACVRAMSFGAVPGCADPVKSEDRGGRDVLPFASARSRAFVTSSGGRFGSFARAVMAAPNLAQDASAASGLTPLAPHVCIH